MGTNLGNTEGVKFDESPETADAGGGILYSIWAFFICTSLLGLGVALLLMGGFLGTAEKKKAKRRAAKLPLRVRPEDPEAGPDDGQAETAPLIRPEARAALAPAAATLPARPQPLMAHLPGLPHGVHTQPRAGGLGPPQGFPPLGAPMAMPLAPYRPAGFMRPA